MGRSTGTMTPRSDRFDHGNFVSAWFSLSQPDRRATPHRRSAIPAKEGSWALNEHRDSSTDRAAASSGSGSTCEVTERWDGEIVVVAAVGVVDMLTAPQLEDALRSAVGNKPEGLVVDLTGVDFLASAGMGVLVAAHDSADAGTRFCVVADGPSTSRPLKLVGIADIVPLYATLDEALEALRG